MLSSYRFLGATLMPCPAIERETWEGAFSQAVGSRAVGGDQGKLLTELRCDPFWACSVLVPASSSLVPSEPLRGIG